MACACGTKKEAKKNYVYTAPDGTKKTYATEVEAAAAAKRGGGSYRAA